MKAKKNHVPFVPYSCSIIQMFDTLYARTRQNIYCTRVLQKMLYTLCQDKAITCCLSKRGISCLDMLYHKYIYSENNFFLSFNIQTICYVSMLAVCITWVACVKSCQAKLKVEREDIKQATRNNTT